ncbi:RING finger protein [bacterium]|nr:RING finger protein [bacterium]
MSNNSRNASSNGGAPTPSTSSGGTTAPTAPTLSGPTSLASLSSMTTLDRILNDMGHVPTVTITRHSTHPVHPVSLDTLAVPPAVPIRRVPPSSRGHAPRRTSSAPAAAGATGATGATSAASTITAVNAKKEIRIVEPCFSFWTNAVVTSVLKVDGVFTGNIVREVVKHGNQFDIYKFCANKNNITCSVPSITHDIFERDVDQYIVRLVANRDRSFDYVLHVPSQGLIYLRVHTNSLPMCISHDTLQLSRTGVTMVSASRVPPILSTKPSPFGYVMAQLARHEYSFVGHDLRQLKQLVWQRCLRENYYNEARTWTRHQVREMEKSWTCAICQSRYCEDALFDKKGVMKLSCSHAFHMSCFVQVRPKADTYHMSCPMCRHEYSVHEL